MTQSTRPGPMNPYPYPTYPNSMKLDGADTCAKCVHFGPGPIGACGKSPRPKQDYCAWRPKRFQPITKKKE